MKKRLLALLLALMMIVPVAFADETTPEDAAAPTPTVTIAELLNGDITQLFPLNDKGQYNLLVLGDDTRDAKKEPQGRSDTIVLVTIDPAKKSIKLTSFMRDILLDIPGHAKNRINTAYRFGGVDLLKKVMKDNFNVDVDGYIVFTFEGVRAITLNLSGVVVKVTAKEIADMGNHSKTDLKEGENELSGNDALLFLRIRKQSGGDDQRTRRARDFLTALVEEVATYTPEQMTDMITKNWANIHKTGYTIDDAMRFGALVLGMAGDVQVSGMAVPVEGTGKNIMYKKMSVKQINLEKNKDAIAAFLAQ